MNCMKIITFKTNSKSNDENQHQLKIQRRNSTNQLKIQRRKINKPTQNPTTKINKPIFFQVTNEPDIDEYTTDIW